MGEFTCLGCGKVVEIEKFYAERKFCNRQCYAKYLKGKKMKKPVFVQRVSRHMCPQGYENLVEGICSRAAMDWLEYPPGMWLHDDAEAFFMSQYFTDLTDMDGDEMLWRLQRLKEKGRKRNGRL